MSRALRYTGAAVVAVAAVLTVRSAPAKNPAVQREGQPAQVETILSQEHLLAPEANARLEEIKVELALLSDIATFPYYLDARGSAEVLQLHGYVPNEQVRQRALELALRSTFLAVKDGLRIQSNPIMRPPPPPPHELQKDAAELLRKNVGEPAKAMSLAVRNDGVIVIRGGIDSLQSKLEISRLFRQLPGCFGVLNELTVPPVERNGQRVVQVMRDGSLFVPLSSLGMQLNPFTSSLPAVPLPTPVPSNKAPSAPDVKPAVVPPVPVPVSSSLEAQKDELRLPTAVVPKPAPERIGTVPYTLEEPKLPVKWTSSDVNWEEQAKKLHRLNMPTAPSVSPTPPLPTPVVQPVQAPVPLPTACRPAQTVWTRTRPKRSPPAETTESQFAKGDGDTPNRDHKGAEGKPLPDGRSSASNAPSGTDAKTSRANVAEKPATPRPDTTWKRPDATEESEPKTAPVPHQKEASAGAAPESRAISTPPAPPVSRVITASPVSPLSRPRRWPPAYESKPPESKGRPGVITFDDDPPPSRPADRTTKPPTAIEPAKLQRQVKSICGRQASEVAVQKQPDGILLVKVKVPNRSAENSLSIKVLAIPEMTSPQVRLLMDVGP